MSEKTTIQEHIDALRKIADYLQKLFCPDSPPKSLWIHSRRKIIRAAKIFLATKDELGDCKGFAGLDMMSKMFGLKVDGADEVLLRGWTFVITPWLRAQRPDRFGGDAGAFDLPPFKLDAKGKPIVKDGKVIRVTADYDVTDWRNHLQDQCDDWADACLALADLLKNRLADDSTGHDPDAYMPVKEARDDWGDGKNYNDFRKARKANPWIRFDPRAPRNRPRVHRADWAKFLKGPINEDTFELIDVEKDYPSIADNLSDESTAEYLADARARKEKIRNEKRRTGK
ncbi:MAG: hypothetical protein KAV00_17010 [Phycisphaerae bacterium]|nr:hypothetical protein [Phycisphaerae bacterium]